MNHLSEQELVEFLYDDFETGTTSAEVQQHLQRCEHCQAELRQLANVARLLDCESAAAEPSVAAATALSAANARRGRRHREASPRYWLTPTVAASLIFFLTCAAFGAGIWWQSRATSWQLAERFRSPEFSQKLAQLVRETTAAQISEYDQSMNGKLGSIAGSLAEIREQDAATDQETQKRLETILGRLVDNQSNLRSELESLALAAESAITSTRRDLQELNQFTKLLAGIPR